MGLLMMVKFLIGTDSHFYERTGVIEERSAFFQCTSIEILTTTYSKLSVNWSASHNNNDIVPALPSADGCCLGPVSGS